METFFWSSFDFKQLYYLQFKKKPLKTQDLPLSGREQQSVKEQFKFFPNQVIYNWS